MVRFPQNLPLRRLSESVPFRDSQLQMELYFSGLTYFSAVKTSLAAARYEIMVESYIFQLGRLGQEILELLRAARQRGVRIRLLVDGVGSASDLRDMHFFCQKEGIEFEVYHPLPFYLPRTPSGILESLRRRMALLGRINNRNHRKLILVDNQEVYLGSLNISDVHLDTTRDLAWRDTGLRLQGPEVSLIKREMEVTWTKAQSFWSKARRSRHLPSWLRLNSRLRWRRRMNRDLLHAIMFARERIFITTPYFLPSPAHLRALKRAAQRGVQVKLLLPERSDVFLFRYVSRSFYRSLIESGIEIWEYQPSVLHAKTMMIDQRAFVGSQNFNQRSLLHDLEIEIATERTDILASLFAQWQRDVKFALPVHPTAFHVLGRILAAIIVRFKYWL